MVDLICPLCRAEHSLNNFSKDIVCSCGKAQFSYQRLKWSLTEKPEIKRIPVIKMTEPVAKKEV